MNGKCQRRDDKIIYTSQKSERMRERKREKTLKIRYVVLFLYTLTPVVFVKQMLNIFQVISILFFVLSFFYSSIFRCRRQKDDKDDKDDDFLGKILKINFLLFSK